MMKRRNPAAANLTLRKTKRARMAYKSHPDCTLRMHDELSGLALGRDTKCIVRYSVSVASGDPRLGLGNDFAYGVEVDQGTPESAKPFHSGNHLASATGAE
jgi:hypothetical protein